MMKDVQIEFVAVHGLTEMKREFDSSIHPTFYYIRFYYIFLFSFFGRGVILQHNITKQLDDGLFLRN